MSYITTRYFSNEKLREDHGCEKGYTTLWRDHFGAARFVVALFDIAHFVAGPFWNEPFWRNFHENNFFLFLIFYFIKIIVFLSFFLFLFFSKIVEDFVYFNKFLSTLHNKIQVQTHHYFFFVCLFQIIPVTDKINS